MVRPSRSHGGQRRVPLRLIPPLTALAIVLACNGDTAPPTAPEFAKGGIPTQTVTSLADDALAAVSDGDLFVRFTNWIWQSLP